MSTTTMTYIEIEGEILANLDNAVSRAEAVWDGPYRLHQPEVQLYLSLAKAGEGIARSYALIRADRLPDANLARLRALEEQYVRVHSWTHSVIRHKRRGVDVSTERLVEIPALKAEIDAFALPE